MRRTVAVHVLIVRGALVAAMVVSSVLAAGCGKGQAGPAVDSISPESGPPMTLVTITGSGFGEEKGFSKVQFGGAAVGVRTWSETEITATVPVGLEPGGYVVTVSTDTGTSPGVGFKVVEQ